MIMIRLMYNTFLVVSFKFLDEIIRKKIISSLWSGSPINSLAEDFKDHNLRISNPFLHTLKL